MTLIKLFLLFPFHHSGLIPFYMLQAFLVVSYLRQAGVDLHTIGTLLGHKDMRMTKRYAHLNVESLRSAVEKLETTTISLQQGKTAGA
jgi:site-specific recombinase XerD